jgi:hypothetical protein
MTSEVGRWRAPRRAIHPRWMRPLGHFAFVEFNDVRKARQHVAAKLCPLFAANRFGGDLIQERSTALTTMCGTFRRSYSARMNSERIESRTTLDLELPRYFGRRMLLVEDVIYDFVAIWFRIEIAGMTRCRRPHG